MKYICVAVGSSLLVVFSVPVRPCPAGFLGPVGYLEYRVVGQHPEPGRAAFVDEGVVPGVEADFEVARSDFGGGGPGSGCWIWRTRLLCGGRLLLICGG